jgi:IclR family acetate operon transcriptional repressor
MPGQGRDRARPVTPPLEVPAFSRQDARMENGLKRTRGRPRAFNPAPEQTTIQALDRAVHILKVLAEGEGMSLTELAEATGQAPATVYRVLSTFEAHGVVEVNPASQLWFVGQEAFRIGSAFLGRTSLVEQARPVMHELMAGTGETANLAIADGAQVVFISQVETQEPIRAFFRPGTRGPIHASGIGKALLAYYPLEAIDRIIGEQGLPAFTPHTITDRDRLLRELAEIRGRGWAVDDGERTEGMRCIAAPIFNEFREAVAGVSISGPTERMGRAGPELGARVRAAAYRITRATGGTGA